MYLYVCIYYCITHTQYKYIYLHISIRRYMCFGLVCEPPSLNADSHKSIAHPWLMLPHHIAQDYQANLNQHIDRGKLFLRLPLTDGRTHRFPWELVSESDTAITVCLFLSINGETARRSLTVFNLG